MKKYNIINERTKQIICKDKQFCRHYRQPFGNIEKGLYIFATTKGRAEKERDYLNKEYYKGWEIKEVEQ